MVTKEAQIARITMSKISKRQNAFMKIGKKWPISILWSCYSMPPVVSKDDLQTW